MGDIGEWFAVALFPADNVLVEILALCVCVNSACVS